MRLLYSDGSGAGGGPGGGGGSGFDFSNGSFLTRFYGSSSVMSPNRPSLLWPSVEMGSGDITSSLVTTVTIW
jgi:hypothetical protein